MRIFTRPIPKQRLRAACFAGLGVLLAFSLFHVWRNLFIEPGAEPGLDFRVLWLAGKLWLEGKNPYGPAFVERYVTLFNNSVNMFWSYPPSWLPISAILALFSFETAFRLWMTTDMLLLTAGTLLLTLSVASRSPSGVWLVFPAALTFACSMQATAITLYIGQTSCVVFFGLAALISGLLTSTPLLLIVGLFLTALKPHVGLVAFVSVSHCRAGGGPASPLGLLVLPRRRASATSLTPSGAFSPTSSFTPTRAIRSTTRKI